MYRDSIIFYSLGNFVFDQYFNEDVRVRMAVGCDIAKDEVWCAFSPLVADKNGKLSFMQQKNRDEFFKKLKELSLGIENQNEFDSGIINVKRMNQ